MPDRELDGRVALVTGASRNIGRAICEALGAGGASVLVHAHRDRTGAEETARLVEAAGGQAAVILGDLTDPAVPAAIVAAALERFGRLDILVGNAAVRPEASIDDLDHATWRHVMALCLDSVFLLTQAALAPLRASDQGAIVTIGGLTGVSGAPGRVHVVTAKAALVGLTKALAHDLGRDAITVNCVAPGMIETVRAGPAPAHHATRANVLGRRGAPEEVAAAVRMLAGPSMRFVTGQTLHVNGGVLMP